MSILHKTTVTLLAAMALQFAAWLTVSAANTDNPAQIRTRRVPAGATMAAETTIHEVGAEVVYSFFPEVAYTVTVSRVEQVATQTVAIQSKARDGRDITCLSVIALDSARLTVRDYDRQRLYQCVSLADGGREYREYDLSKELPRTPCPPMAPPVADALGKEATPAVDLMSSGEVALAAAATVYLDVMVVFDTTAQAWAANNGGIAAFAADAIARMNVAMQTTGIDCTFRLAKTVTKSYTYNGTDLSNVLNDITNNTGVFSDIETLRTTYGADLVTLMVDTGSAYGSTGIGWLLSSSPWWRARYAYTTCSIRAVNQSHTHTHEIGHNLGCGHATNQVSSPGPEFFPYSAGYYFTANKKKYHTIMAYNNDGYGNYYYDSDYFSTPLETYGSSGVVVGNSSTSDNARTIRETMAAASAYRTSVIITPPSAPTGVSATDGTLTTGVTVTWNAVPDASYYRVYRAMTSGGTKSALGSWQTGVSYFDASAVAGTTYYYFVAASADSAGTHPSAFSAYATGKRALPINDAFDSALALSGNSGSTSGTNEGATKQAGEPEHDGEATAVNSLWWTWAAPASGQVLFDTIGSSFDTVLATYTGTAVGALTPVASNDDAIGTASRVAVNAIEGTIYRIAVAGYGGEYGTLVLNWSFVAATEPMIASSWITTTSGTKYYHVSFNVRSGHMYYVQRTDSLTSPLWLNVATVVATYDGTKTVSLTIPSAKASGFYRVKLAE
ncbi:MAG: M12 family metallo-peptidase [Kiritimatiellae bacterium]|nr:M12 family metallo-peptidase [Kiritimatiellia bacterium]